MYNSVGNGFDCWSSVKLDVGDMIREFMLDACLEELPRSNLNVLDPSKFG